MNTTVPTASAHYSTAPEPVTARWAGHIETVVIDVGRTFSLHLSKDTAIMLANQLTDAVDEAETLPSAGESA